MIGMILRMTAKFETCLTAILFSVNLAILFVAVVMRYIFNNAPSWPEEASRYIMIWIVYIGVLQAIDKNCEIKIDILPMALANKNKLSKLFKMLTLIISLAVSVMISLHSIQFYHYLVGIDQSAASFAYPKMAFIYSIIPVSAVLMCVKYICKILISMDQFDFFINTGA